MCHVGVSNGPKRGALGTKTGRDDESSRPKAASALRLVMARAEMTMLCILRVRMRIYLLFLYHATFSQLIRWQSHAQALSRKLSDFTQARDDSRLEIITSTLRTLGHKKGFISMDDCAMLMSISRISLRARASSALYTATAAAVSNSCLWSIAYFLSDSPLCLFVGGSWISSRSYSARSRRLKLPLEKEWHM